MSWFGKKEKSLEEQAKEAQDALSKTNKEITLKGQIESASLINQQRQNFLQLRILQSPSLHVFLFKNAFLDNEGIVIGWTVSGLIGNYAEVWLMKDGNKVQTLWGSVCVEQDGRIEWTQPTGKKHSPFSLPWVGNNFQIKFIVPTTGMTAISNYFSISPSPQQQNNRNNHGRGRNRSGRH